MSGLPLQDGGGTILAIRFGAFGDIVRTLPAVGFLRRHFHGCRVLWAMDDRWSGFFDGRAGLDGLLVMPRRRGPAAVLRWLAGLRSSGADVVLDFHGNLRSGIAGWCAGAPLRLGYDGHQQKEGNRLFTNRRIPPGPRRTSRIERNLALVQALGVDTSGPLDAGLRLGAAEEEQATRLLDEILGDPARPFAVLSPGASVAQIYKRPPLTLLTPAVSSLERAGLPTLVVWGPGEEADARRVAEAAPGTAYLAPATGLPTLAALLRRARLFVGGDTGPLHLACGMGCPVVGIYAPTDPVVNTPWGVPFRVVAPPGAAYTGIKQRDRRIGRFEEIDAGQVEQAVSELLVD